jgi:hypothetical protein
MEAGLGQYLCMGGVPVDDGPGTGVRGDPKQIEEELSDVAVANIRGDKNFHR